MLLKPIVKAPISRSSGLSKPQPKCLIRVMGEFQTQIGDAYLTEDEHEVSDGLIPRVVPEGTLFLLAYLTCYPTPQATGPLREVLGFEIGQALQALQALGIVTEDDNGCVALSSDVDTDVALILQAAGNSRVSHRDLKEAVRYACRPVLPGMNHAWLTEFRSRCEAIRVTLTEELLERNEQKDRFAERRVSESAQEKDQAIRLAAVELAKARQEALQYRSASDFSVLNGTESRHGLVGREQEIHAALGHLLAPDQSQNTRSDHPLRRWVTITGPQGVGKSALLDAVGKAWNDVVKGRLIYIPLA